MGVLFSPFVFVVARLVRSRKLLKAAVQMDPMNVRAISAIAPGRQLEVQRLAIAAQFIVSEDSETLGSISNYYSKSNAQLFQDLFALLASAGKRNGVFVEVGVGDGRYLSNTYMLEKEFEWSGVLIEPNRSSHESIKACRSALLDTRAATSCTGDLLEFEEVKGAGEYSRLAGAKGHELERFEIEKYPVSTVTLVDLFEELQIPLHIDFISIDTEGSEIDVLLGIDFQKYSFTALAIEHNYDVAKLRLMCDLLTAQGYRRIFTDVSGFDAWFVSADSAILDLRS